MNTFPYGGVVPAVRALAIQSGAERRTPECCTGGRWTRMNTDCSVNEPPLTGELEGDLGMGSVQCSMFDVRSSRSMPASYARTQKQGRPRRARRALRFFEHESAHGERESSSTSSLPRVAPWGRAGIRLRPAGFRRRALRYGGQDGGQAARPTSAAAARPRAP